MKTKLLLFVALLLLVLACECEPTNPQYSIIGDWWVQSCLVSEYVNDVLVNESLIDYLKYNEVIRFIEGGAGAWIYDGVIDEFFAWKIDEDNKNLLVVDGIGEVLSYRVQIKENIFLYENESVFTAGTRRTRLVFSFVAFRVNKNELWT